MLLGPILLLACSIAVETGPARADSLALDGPPTAGAACLVPGVPQQQGSLPFGILSQPDELSPWDDEIEFPDDSETEEPEDPGEALHSKNPARDPSKSCTCSGPIEPAALRSRLTIVPSPQSAGSSRSPVALCRLLF